MTKQGLEEYPGCRFWSVEMKLLLRPGNDAVLGRLGDHTLLRMDGEACLNTTAAAEIHAECTMGQVFIRCCDIHAQVQGVSPRCCQHRPSGTDHL